MTEDILSRLTKSLASFFPLLLSVWALLPLAFAKDASVQLSAGPESWSHIPTNGILAMEVRLWPATGKLSLPASFPNITAAHLVNGLHREPLRCVFSGDSTQLELELASQAPATLPATVLLETATNTAQ